MLEVGKTYELNDGSVEECTHTITRSDGDVVYVLDDLWYHKDGRCGCFEHEPDYEYHIRRCVEDNCQTCNGSGIVDRYSTWEGSCPDCKVETPTIWRDMTDAEKGALLLAEHEGKVTEVWNVSYWETLKGLGWHEGYAYRIKPDPKVETVVLENDRNCGWSFYEDSGTHKNTHRITFNLIDGKPDPKSIKMEKL